jgi:hypothetical protein
VLAGGGVLVGAVVELLVVVALLAGAVVELLVVAELLAGAVVVVVLPAGALAVLPVDVVLLDGVVAVPVLAVDELVEAAPLAEVSEPPHADSKPIRTIAETQRSALVLDIGYLRFLSIAVQNSISKKTDGVMVKI